MTRARKLLLLNVAALVLSIALWITAAVVGWLESVAFVSHVSMGALVLAAVSGIAAGDAAVEAEDVDEEHTDWGSVPPAPLREVTMDPPPNLTADLAPPQPAPTYVDPDEWDTTPGLYL